MRHGRGPYTYRTCDGAVANISSFEPVEGPTLDIQHPSARRFESAAVMASALRGAAREAGGLASASEVSAWVATSFGVALSERRALLDQAVDPVAPPSLDLGARDSEAPTKTAVDAPARPTTRRWSGCVAALQRLAWAR